MSLKVFRRASVRLVVIAAMIAGISLTSVSIASAQVRPDTGNNWYVSTGGTNTGRNCSSQSLPCKTIAYALSEQAAEHVSGTVHVAKGTYSGQVIVAPANHGDTIEGAGSSGASATIVSPGATPLTSDTDTDSGNSEYAIIDVTLGTNAFKVEDLQVNGTAGIPNISCGQDYVGIYYHGSSGTISKVSVLGIDPPPGAFGCQGGQGIYVDSLSSDPATVTMTSVNESVPANTTKTTAALPADTYDGHDILPVQKIPSGFHNGQGIVVNGYNLTAKKDNAKALYITGTTSTASPKGSLVNFNPYQPAFAKNGITCDDNWTICTITSSTIQGEGPTNSNAQNGIQGYGAEQITLGGATQALGNNVTGFSYAGADYSATAILLISNGQTLVENNNVSASDTNIYAGELDFGGTPEPYAPVGSWTISDNTVSDATCSGVNVASPGCQSGWGVGIQLDSTASSDASVSGNTVSGSKQTAILLTGVQNALVSGNVITGNNLDTGITLSGPGSECEIQYGNDCVSEVGNGDQYSSTGNQVVDNMISGSGIGSLALGAYGPSFVGGPNSDAATGNSYAGNTWSSNAINVADFSGYGATPAANSYGSFGSYMNNSPCEPSAGGSTTLNTESGNSDQ